MTRPRTPSLLRILLVQARDPPAGQERDPRVERMTRVRAPEETRRLRGLFIALVVQTVKEPRCVSNPNISLILCLARVVHVCRFRTVCDDLLASLIRQEASGGRYTLETYVAHRPDLARSAGEPNGGTSGDNAARNRALMEFVASKYDRTEHDTQSWERNGIGNVTFMDVLQTDFNLTMRANPALQFGTIDDLCWALRQLSDNNRVFKVCPQGINPSQSTKDTFVGKLRRCIFMKPKAGTREAAERSREEQQQPKRARIQNDDAA